MLTPEQIEGEKPLFSAHLAATGWCDDASEIVWDALGFPHAPGCDMRWEWQAWLARAEIAAGDGARADRLLNILGRAVLNADAGGWIWPVEMRDELESAIEEGAKPHAR